MVNKLFVASTTRYKMPSKKARVTLRQPKVFFPLSYHAIVASRVVPPGICPRAFALVLSLRLSINVDRVILISDEAWRPSTLFASIILVSEEYYFTHYK